MPDLASTRRRERDPDKEEKVRQAAERAIKEIRTYGFEVRWSRPTAVPGGATGASAAAAAAAIDISRASSLQPLVEKECGFRRK